ncbi:MAG: hypothetical protein V2G43_04870 [bacterium JZ-2024 1]
MATNTQSRLRNLTIPPGARLPSTAKELTSSSSRFRMLSEKHYPPELFDIAPLLPLSFPPPLLLNPAEVTPLPAHFVKYYFISNLQKIHPILNIFPKIAKNPNTIA